MDGNPTGGSGNMMMQEIEAAVRLHGKGDIFTVDIPANRWHYVVYKSFADRFPMELLILKLKDDGR